MHTVKGPNQILSVSSQMSTDFNYSFTRTLCGKFATVIIKYPTTS